LWLGTTATVQGLLRCQKSEGADILFLSETKLDEKRMQEIKSMVRMTGMVVVSNEGKSGGLPLLWRDGELMWL
jgi:hypothetical protein